MKKLFLLAIAGVMFTSASFADNGKKKTKKCAKSKTCCSKTVKACCKKKSSTASI